MTKPKLASLNTEMETLEWADKINEVYAAGLRDGEKGLARALRRWVNRVLEPEDAEDIKGWLSARQKKERK